ncbi:MAG: hypothetical protein ACI4R6_01020, partial [Lachnospiraceae bacterium]
MKILLTAFKNTSTEMLFSDINIPVLVLPNDMEQDRQLLIASMHEMEPDCIISFGQKPAIKDKVYVELTAHSGIVYKNTTFRDMAESIWNFVKSYDEYVEVKSYIDSKDNLEIKKKLYLAIEK